MKRQSHVQRPWHVKKASGQQERFSPEKLWRSLQRTGAPQSAVERVADRIVRNLRPGATTDQIYRRAHRLLGKEESRYAGRYKLKRAMLELGPSGYPFEQFIAGLLSAHGYTCATNQVVKGACVAHEVDIIATREAKHAWIECKYRNLKGGKSDVKVPLYCYARYLDLKAAAQNPQDYTFWVVTNTKFTQEAWTYGSCVGLHLMAWTDPNGHAIQSMIEAKGYFPITCLSSLNRTQQKRLIHDGILAIPQLLKEPDLLSRYAFEDSEQLEIIQEAKALGKMHRQKLI